MQQHYKKPDAKHKHTGTQAHIHTHTQIQMYMCTEKKRGGKQRDAAALQNPDSKQKHTHTRKHTLTRTHKYVCTRVLGKREVASREIQQKYKN